MVFIKVTEAIITRLITDNNNKITHCDFEAQGIKASYVEINNSLTADIMGFYNSNKKCDIQCKASNDIIIRNYKSGQKAEPVACYDKIVEIKAFEQTAFKQANNNK